MKLAAELVLRRKHATKDDYRKMVKENLDEVTRLKDISNNLLALHRGDQSALSSVQLNAPATPDFLKRDRRIKFDVPKSVILLSNQRIMEEIARIFIDNAFKYGATKMTIAWNARGSAIDFSDNGRGVAHKDLPYIFKDFYRASDRRPDGSGLGLPLAKKLAHQINAEIKVRSALGHGSTFSLVFSKKAVLSRRRAAP
jgi:two-component system sensor histidine kinase SaeS